jgi:ABC-type transport system involved in multi-copper enzyme maturation permease subunit
MLEWMRDRNIQPLWPNNFWLTQYDVYFDEGIEPIVRNDFEKRHSSSGSYFNYHLFEKLFTMIGIFFFIFLFSDIVTKEGEGRNGPINLLRTMPLHRLAVLTSKFGAVLLMTIGTLTGIFLFATLLGTVFDRFGDWDYPTLIYGENYTYEWVPLSLFLIKSVWLFLLVLIFSYSLLFFFSFLTNRAIIALGITLTLLVLGVNWAEQSVLTANTHLLPFHYLNVFPIISNEFAVLHDNFAFSYQNGVISLAISSIVLLFSTYVLSVYRYRTRG